MRAIVVLAVLLLAACRCESPTPGDGGTDAGEPNDAGHPPGSVVSLAFNGDFGVIRIGSNASRTAVIKNEGLTLVRLLGFSTTSLDFTVTGVPPLQLQPGETGQVVVTANTARTGTLNGELRFAIDGVQQDIQLTAEVAGPVLELGDEALDFPLVGVFDGLGGSSEQTMVITNVGRSAFPPTIDATLEVSVAGVSQLTGDPAMLCVDDCTGATLRLSPSVSAPLRVKVSADTPGARSWQVNLATTDLSRPLVTVTVTATFVRLPLCQYTLTPSQVDFGSVGPGEERETEAVFENTGTEDCVVSSMSLDQLTFPTSAFLASANVPATVPPGGFLRVRLGVRPADGLLDFALHGTLELGINVPSGTASIDLEAFATVGSCLAVLPTRVDFGEVRAGCASEWRTIWVANHCGTPLSVNAVRSGHPLFEVADAGSFDPGLGTPLRVRYLPGATGPDESLLSLDWASPATSLTTVEVRGTGSAQGTHVQRFEPNTAVDILLVLDDSASMLSRQAVLDAQLPWLISTLLQSSANFSLAVVMGNEGPGLGDLRQAANGEWVLGPSTSNIQTRFRELTRLTGTGGARSCAKGALWALTPPHLGRTFNQYFRRPGAQLVVLCITDGPETDAFFVPQVLALGDSVTWHAIAPIDAQTGLANCGLNRPASFYDSHRVLPEATGGQRVDFCSSNWVTALDPTAHASANGRSFLRLDGHPDPLMPDLQVAVNGAVLGGNAWAWDAGTNVVTLSAQPGGGARVDLQWSAACNP